MKLNKQKTEDLLSNNYGKAVAAGKDKQIKPFLLTKLPLTDFIHQSCNYGQGRPWLHFLLGVSVANKNCGKTEN